jgi:hypothetical protein
LKNRFYIFNYFKNNSDYNQLLITDAGVHQLLAKLTLEDEYLSIKVETFKNLYNVIRQNLLNIIKGMKIKYLETSSYINLFSDSLHPFKGNDIRKKLEETSNVSILCPVFRDFN